MNWRARSNSRTSERTRMTKELGNPLRINITPENHAAENSVDGINIDSENRLRMDKAGMRDTEVGS